MGKNFSKRPDESKLSLEDDEISTSRASSSIIKLINLQCLRNKKKRKTMKKSHSKHDVGNKTLSQREEYSAESKSSRVVSLEEFLLASPGTEPGCFKGGELYVFGQGQSFSLKKLMKAEREREADHDEEEYFSTSPVCKDENMNKLRKRVSFRLPEEADIIVFYSPRSD